jgi:uncharacterized protein DUF6920
MNDHRSDLDALFRSVPEASRRFDPADYAHLPAAAQRYLARAIAPGTPLASAVRLRMHGSIRLKRWLPFMAEQVIALDRGMIWRARVRMGPLTVRGFDRYLGGEGAMRWKVCGLVPVVSASGDDVTRSAAGRLAAESIWLPSTFCSKYVSWTAEGDHVVHARLAVDGNNEDLRLTTSAGSLQSVAMRRWGNPDGGAFASHDFGALVEQEAVFGGYTIPVRVCVGWYFGSARFDTEGRFFHATIDDATFR